MNSDQEPNDELMNDIVDDADTEDSAYGLGPIYLHRWIDCQDEYNKWYEAQIIALSSSSPHRIKVHYKGWKSKFDSWIDLQSEPERARPLHTFTTRPPSVGTLDEFTVGTKCDCLDSTDKWCQAEIVEIESDTELVRVHYVGWSTKYDEWINTDSYRIAPLHSKTSPQQNQSTSSHTNTNTSTTTNNNRNTPNPSNTVSTNPASGSGSAQKSKRRDSFRVKRKKPKRSVHDGGGGGSVRMSNVTVLNDDDSHPITAMEVEDPEYKDTENVVIDDDPEIKEEDHGDDDIHDVDTAAANGTTDAVKSRVQGSCPCIPLPFGYHLIFFCRF